MQFEKGPLNLNPFHALEKLVKGNVEKELEALVKMVNTYPYQSFLAEDPSTHPEFKPLPSTTKELNSINSYLQRIKGIIKITLPILEEVLTYPNAQQETRAEYSAVLKLDQYIECILKKVHERKSQLDREERDAKTQLLSAVPDDLLRKLLRHYLDQPLGES